MNYVCELSTTRYTLRLYNWWGYIWPETTVFVLTKISPKSLCIVSTTSPRRLHDISTDAHTLSGAELNTTMTHPSYFKQNITTHSNRSSPAEQWGTWSTTQTGVLFGACYILYGSRMPIVLVAQTYLNTYSELQKDRDHLVVLALYSNTLDLKWYNKVKV